MRGFLRTSCLVAVLALSSVQLALSHSAPNIEDPEFFNLQFNSTAFEPETRFAGLERQDDSFELRIMPLGASIMSGMGSSGNGGLRRYLRAALVEDGWKVNMVGTRKSGNMIDNDHEANPGDVIDDVRARAKRAYGFKPNVIIINAGTNDANFAVDLRRAGERMEKLLNEAWEAPGMESTCIFLSTLLPTDHPDGKVNRIAINDQYRQLVSRRAADGDCIFLAEMAITTVSGVQTEIFQYPEHFCADYFNCDYVHPNNEGHKLMASIFRQAITTASRAKKLKAPSGDFESVSNVCDKHAGTGYEAGGLTQRGSGADDGIYFHDSQEMPISFTADSEWDRKQWHFARLFSQGYDDLLASLDRDDDDNVDNMVVWLNSADGKGEFKQAASEMKPGIDCEFDRVKFLDMNADGLDDFVCLFSDGHIEVAINNGDGSRSSGKPPTFNVAGAERPAGEDVSSSRVVLGDIDGDGRGDYGIILESGEIKFWRNDGGVDDRPRKWQALGVRFGPAPMKDQKGYRLEDINGDGRDDMLFVDTIGETTTWTNARSCKKGSEGDGLNVAWRQGYYHGLGTGPTHFGLPGADGDIRHRIHFARIYGDTPITGNFAKLDYVFMEHEKKDGSHLFNMRVWKNTGYGGTKLLADGNKYCNIMGHQDGAVDYVWAWGGGMMELWENRGKKEISNSDPDGWWDYKGYIFEPSREMSRRDLHLADWDGDGRCDIIHVDPEDGTIEVFRNDGKAGIPGFKSLGNPAPQLKCKYRKGQGIHDIAVRFADLTGNGRTDYLCMAPDATTTGFVQDDDGGFEDVGQIKMPDGYDRANYHWSDVNADGKDDLIWVEKFSGDGYVWYNEKQGNPGEFSGSAFYWRRQAPPDKAYAGQVAGTCEHFVDLDGNGHADIHYILGTFNNKAQTSLNPDCGLVDTEPGNDPYQPLPDPPNPDPSDPNNPDDPPEYCTSGTSIIAADALARLCRFTCRFGFCPSPPCKCLKYGPLEVIPADLAGPGTASLLLDNPAEAEPLCKFACRKLFCPPGVCERAKGELDACEEYDRFDEATWAASGAERMVESFISYFGSRDWLKEMDEIFGISGDPSSSECDAIDKTGCDDPVDCTTFHPSATYYFVELMAHRIADNFKAAKSKLDSETLKSFLKLDGMVDKFKIEDEDDKTLSKVFGGISAAFAISGALAASATGPASALGIIGTLFGLIGSNVKPSTDATYENIKLKAQDYLVKTLEAGQERLGETLSAVFDAEGSNSTYVNELVKTLPSDTPGSNNIIKLLHGGELYKSSEQLNRTTAVEQAIGEVQSAVLGSVLSGLHFLVVGIRGMSEAQCNEQSAAKWGSAPTPRNPQAKACLYMVSKQSDDDSVSIKEDMLKALEDDYNIELQDLVVNVALCHNAPGDNNGGQVYLGPERYAPCFFVMPFVDAEDFLTYPIFFAVKDGFYKDQYPAWLADTEFSDGWDDPMKWLCDNDQDNCERG